MSIREQVAGLCGAAALRVRAVEDQLLTTKLAPYGVAVGRMLAGCAYVGILLTNFGHRELLFGPGSAWVQPLRDESPQNAWVGAAQALTEPWFTIFYLGVIAVGVAFVLGWHGKVAGVLLLLGAVQIVELNPLVGDQGDNILRVGLLLTLLTDCTGLWSLDARRRRLNGGRIRTLRTATAILHNAAVIALAGNVVIVYISAGMYKVGSTVWQFGTGTAYPLLLDEYRVWPTLNDLVTASGIGVFFMTYIAVYLQLYFPALLLNRVTRRVALAAVIGLHLGIAVLMGLPWFSLAMVAFDGIFVSTSTYLAVERFVVPRWERLWESAGRRLVRA